MNIAYLHSSKKNWYNEKTYEILSSYGKVTRFDSYGPETNFKNFDIIFIEFLTINAVNISLKKEKNQKVMIRTHGIEIYEFNFDKTNLESVDWILTLTEHQKKYFNSKLKDNNFTKSDLFFLPAPYDELKLKKNLSKNNNIAFPAHITGRKGHDQIVEFLKKYPDYHIHVLGDICAYGGPVWEYVNWNLKKINLHKNLTWIKKQGWEAMNEWYEKMSYVWLPSVQEGQSRVLMEGMCKGLTPIARNWAGSHELWPKDCIYEEINDIGKILKNEFNPIEQRKYIMEKFNHKDIKEKFKYFIES